MWSLSHRNTGERNSSTSRCGSPLSQVNPALQGSCFDHHLAARIDTWLPRKAAPIVTCLGRPALAVAFIGTEAPPSLRSQVGFELPFLGEPGEPDLPKTAWVPLRCSRKAGHSALGLPPGAVCTFLAADWDSSGTETPPHRHPTSRASLLRRAPSSSV